MAHIAYQRLPSIPNYTDKDNDMLNDIVFNFFEIRHSPLNLRNFWFWNKLNNLFNPPISDSIEEEYDQIRDVAEVFRIKYEGAFDSLYSGLSEGDLSYVKDNFMPSDPNQDLQELKRMLERMDARSITTYFFPKGNSTNNSPSSKSSSIRDRQPTPLNNSKCSNALRHIDNKSLQQLLQSICPYLTNESQPINDTITKMFNRKVFYSNTINIRDPDMNELEYMEGLFRRNPEDIYFDIARVRHNTSVDAGGLTRQFLTSLSKQFVAKYLKRLSNRNNIYIFKRDLADDDYKFVGAILIFLLRNNNGINIRLSLMDVAGLIYKPIKPRTRHNMDGYLEDYNDIERYIKHFELSNSSESWMKDHKKTTLSYHDILMFYLLEFGINKDIKRLIDRERTSIKKIVDESMIDIYEYDPYTKQSNINKMYKNILCGMRISKRNFFIEKQIGISGLARVLARVESVKRNVKSILIPKIVYYDHKNVVMVSPGIKELFDRVLSMPNRVYKRLLAQWIRLDNDPAKTKLLEGLPQHEDFVKAILEFWTGSGYILIDQLSEYSVRAMNNSGHIPVAHTCGQVMELSEHYKDVDEIVFKFLDAILIMEISKFQFV
ncbi:hypothetical protein GUITHDRAFT_133415 [Guillardia theta CCMP2712]|uniref:HECT domain-containing protein n=1 Tax=Guillardia theta (strain CCMP2712) TaxID=905079 RepID=L1JWR9_GUITC|nr:hypothetical protein GUITHDRAFT_133415 [Guillardia theta CCMP2712]EKX53031.1 hypothetical protein GUITHDRAFT_133415 [Guillardia theta CCMP2712]|eukprot:XP_005840011.1 hypothetical protein GUITHDRAFT_133415 [Guillardia theta CCMP2712]